MKETIIKDLEELKQLASRDGGIDCYIKLSMGAKSSKHVDYDANKDVWYIFNEADGAYISCLPHELPKKTNILEALSKRALILEQY